MMRLLLNRRGAAPGTFFLRHVPATLVEYPFEVMLSIWGIIAGAVALLFSEVPTSIVNLMPGWVGNLWGGALLLGGAATAYGLHRGWYATLVPRGMQLVASACAFYSVAIVAVVKLQGVPAALLLFLIAALLALRAWFLQIREVIFADIERESRR